MANEKGVALVISLLMLVVLAFLGIAAMSTGGNEMEIATNERWATQAFFLADSGAGRVKQWFEDPTRFAAVTDIGTRCVAKSPSITPVPTDACWYMTFTKSDGTAGTFPGDLFKKRRIDVNGKLGYINASGNSQFLDVNSDGTLDTNNANDDGQNPNTTDRNTQATSPHKDGNWPALHIADQTLLDSIFGSGELSVAGVGKITLLEIYPPLTGGSTGNHAVIRIEAESNVVRVSGETLAARRRIEQEVGPSMFIAVKGGIETATGAGWNGSGTINWGPAYAKGSVSFTNLNSLNCINTDPDPNCSESSGVRDQWFKGYVETTATAGGNPTLCDASCAANQKWKYFNIFENQTVSIDQMNFTDIASYAKANGYYYIKCSDGDIHKTSCSTTGQSVDDWTKNKSLDLFFVDFDASLAASDKKISISGNYATASNIFVNGDIKFSGMGNGCTPPTSPCQSLKDPDGNSYNYETHVQGVVYAKGNLDFGGNPKIYGALIADGSYTGSGNPTIYYNKQLEDGILNLPKVSRQAWRDLSLKEG